jgi:2-aminoadipate transaminase
MEPTCKFSALGRRARLPTIARLMSTALEKPKLLSLAAGFTDNATLPSGMVVEAVSRIAGKKDKEALQYGTNQGRPGLRTLLAEHFRKWEPALADAAIDDEFFVTNGSQQALYLAMQVLCDPGDIVLVDRPSYFVYLEMLKGMGVQARSIPVDADGVVDEEGFGTLIDGLKNSGEITRLKAVYFVSYYSNPSSRSLSLAEKIGISEVLKRAEVVLPVIEDAAYRDLYFENASAVPSVVGIDAWQDFPKLYLSTLTKPFASGLKIGYGYCSHREWLDKMLHTKGHQDFGTAHFNQSILEEVLSDGGLSLQLAVIRPKYQHKMRVLDETLRDEGLLASGWKWQVPEGGLYLWLEAPSGVDTGLDSKFAQSCIEEGVLYVHGELCFGDDAAKNFVRLSYGVLSEDDLREAGCPFAKVAVSNRS